jgi:hypothetical protein
MTTTRTTTRFFSDFRIFPDILSDFFAERLLNDDHDEHFRDDHDAHFSGHFVRNVRLISMAYGDNMHQICRFGAEMRGKNKFKASEVKRAIRSVTQAGFVIEGVRIGHDGTIELKVHHEGAAATANEWDEAARQ